MEPEGKQPLEFPSASADRNEAASENPAAGDAGNQAPLTPETMQESPAPDDLTPVAPPEVERGIRWVFMGPQGLRAGWSVLVFAAVFILVIALIAFVVNKLHVARPGQAELFTAPHMIIGEALQVLAILIAAFVVALIERRKLLDFNLRGPRRTQHFFAGLAIGFLALSALIGMMAAGGWAHFAGGMLSGKAIAEYAFLWGCCFLLVGFAEEGMFRCYLQFTLTRGINFWWALGVNAALCLDLVLRAKGNGVWGVYVIALLGLIPCYLLHRSAGAHSAFWQAAWVTSTAFGFLHTGNGGENWVGIFSAAAIGFIFCVSIWVTGSAWWAIGCHAGWDWAETYFYGTADSGLVAKGHFLSTTPAGNRLWSGGTDGPEGSLLILAVLVLLLVWLVTVYGRRGAAGKTNPAAG